MKWVPVMAVVLLAASCQWHASVPPLLAPETPVNSAAEIAARLDGHRAEPPYPGSGPPPLNVGIGHCPAKDKDELAPPQDAPGYSTRLGAAEIAAPLSVRIWLTSPEEAEKLTKATMRAYVQCYSSSSWMISHHGWNGAAMTVTEPTSTDNGDVVTYATVLAWRDGLLAEASWWWPVDIVNSFTRLDRGQLDRGTDAAKAVLDAVGGVP
ncbi:hypothetical protein Aph01nite_41120 [Acrocarpospora phusangensis]|uniref:PknH-like extracellular domain-containing protein n=1 Tax=Acrocarpospora phusangensis TaxID=1070424 RepID=A0A919UPL2_9ACTN|nr:hypothetical protein [Acrocarpospora phusangensis]GIH25802.1 hypothetical protein Aph01nite_41120 [Acrocarpospora phusangensis]